jgi:hypothetical protein
MAGTGIRRGEACGLRWDDIDLTERAIVVRQQLVQESGRKKRKLAPAPCPYCDAGHLGVSFGKPKTASGDDRVIDLDEATIGALLSHKLRQDEERREYGAAYADHGSSSPVRMATPCAPTTSRGCSARSLTRCDSTMTRTCRTRSVAGSAGCDFTTCATDRHRSCSRRALSCPSFQEARTLGDRDHVGHVLPPARWGRPRCRGESLFARAAAPEGRAAGGPG